MNNQHVDAEKLRDGLFNAAASAISKDQQFLADLQQNGYANIGFFNREFDRIMREEFGAKLDLSRYGQNMLPRLLLMEAAVKKIDPSGVEGYLMETWGSYASIFARGDFSERFVEDRDNGFKTGVAEAILGFMNHQPEAKINFGDTQITVSDALSALRRV